MQEEIEGVYEIIWEKEGGVRLVMLSCFFGSRWGWNEVFSFWSEQFVH